MADQVERTKCEFFDDESDVLHPAFPGVVRCVIRLAVTTLIDGDDPATACKCTAESVVTDRRSHDAVQEDQRPSVRWTVRSNVGPDAIAKAKVTVARSTRAV